MKIALYVHCFLPEHYHGTETYTFMVAKQLAERGHQVTVVTARFYGEPVQSQFIEEYTYEGLPVVRIDKNQMPNSSVRDTYHQPDMQAVHEGILRRLRPDIIHVCHLISHTSALLDTAVALGIPIMATFTDFFGFCYTNILEAENGSLCSGPDATRANCIACHLKATVLSSGPEMDWRSLAYPQLRPHVAQYLAWRGRRSPDYTLLGFRPADLIDRPDVLAKAMQAYRLAIAPTLYLKHAYERVGAPTPIQLSRFGIDLDRAPKPASPTPDRIRIGFIGQIARHKGVHILVDALKAAERPNLSLTIWGATDQQPGYTEHLMSNSADLPIRFAGTFPVAEITDKLAEIDVLAIPSTWYENCPLILLQALATHTPVIISDVPGMTEVVEEGRNSFRFPRGDTDALMAILRRIADHDGLIARMSQQTEYLRTSRHMVDDIEAAYHSVLQTVSLQQHC
jgi:glycosyltransferase involved in cell wall biosynthesis